MLLLLPDFSEIGIPGFLSLKRRVQEQESKLEEQEAKLVALDAQMTQAIGLRQKAVQDVDTRANAMSVNVLDIAGVLRRFESKAEQELLAASDREHESEDLVPVAKAQLESRLLRIWAQLEPPVKTGLAYQASRNRAAVAEENFRSLTKRLPGLTEVEKHLTALANEDPAAVDVGELNLLIQKKVDLEAMERAAMHTLDLAAAELSRIEDSTASEWSARFDQEIRIARVAHNALIHGEPIEDDKLSAAVRLAEGLLEAWRIRSGSASEGRNSQELE
jgi:hypothetical protein